MIRTGITFALLLGVACGQPTTPTTALWEPIELASSTNLANGATELRISLGEEERGVLSDDRVLPIPRPTFAEHWLERAIQALDGGSKTSFTESVTVNEAKRGSFVRRRSLVVETSVESAEKVKLFIRALKADDPSTVVLHIYIQRRRAPDSKGPSYRSIPKAAAENLIHDWREESLTLMAQLPDVHIPNGHRTRQNRIRDFPFVKDFDVRNAGPGVAKGPRAIQDEVREGWIMDLSAVVHRGKLSLDMSVVANLVTRPVRTFTTTMGTSHITFELPEVVKKKLEVQESFSTQQGGLLVTNVLLPVIVVDGKDRFPFQLGKDLHKTAKARWQACDLLFVADIHAPGARIRSELTVVAADATAKVAVARAPGPTGWKPGASAVIWRYGKPVGKGRVKDVQGDFIELEITEGDLRSGDRVR
ncbi:MAG: hypothetical protein CMJ83_03595 [Planctomycetes bacterium]|nr:hypothetical protein [Planctomycetota bacterium]